MTNEVTPKKKNSITKKNTKAKNIIAEEKVQKINTSKKKAIKKVDECLTYANEIKTEVIQNVKEKIEMPRLNGMLLKLLLLFGLFVGLYAISNVIIVKEIDIFTMTVTASVITYPILFVLSDIIYEKYGYKYVAIIILLSAIIVLITTSIVTLIYYMPGLATSTNNAFQLLFKENYIVIIASIFAYLISQLLNLQLYNLYRENKINKLASYIIVIAIALFIDAVLFKGLLALFNGFHFSLEEIISRFIVSLCIATIFLPIYYFVTFKRKSKSN